MPRPLIVLLLLPALALSQGAAYGIALYKDVGVPVAVGVEVGPGNGTVEIRGLAYYDQLLLLSTTFACWEAAVASGHDPFALNYTVYINPIDATRALIGPSLSLAVAVAAYNALTHTPSNLTIAYTGTVTPGGFVDFVGGVREKAIGARRANFTLFVYPALQHYDYKFELRPRLIGVYGTLIKVLRERPQNLSDILPVAEVGNVYQAFAIATSQEYDIFDNVERLNQMVTAMVAPPPAEKLAVLKKEVHRTVNKTLKLAAQEEYRDVLANGVARALSYLQLGEERPELATEAYPRALREVLYPYFYARLLTKSDAAITEMQTYTDVILQIAEKLMPDVGSENLCDGAYAHMYLHTAKNLLPQAQKYLRYYLAFHSPVDAAYAAYGYAQVVYYAWKSILYAEPPRDKAVELNKTASRLAHYLNTALNYAELYSAATGVASPQLLGDALRNTRLGSSAPPPAAVGYYIEALSNILTYFALHPSFPNTTAVKYLHFADALSHTAGGPPQLLYTENIAQANLTDINETRVYLLAKIYACKLAEKLAIYTDTPPREMPKQRTTALPTATPGEESGEYLTPLAVTIGIILCVQGLYQLFKKHKK